MRFIWTSKGTWIDGVLKSKIVAVYPNQALVLVVKFNKKELLKFLNIKTTKKFEKDRIKYEKKICQGVNSIFISCGWDVSKTSKITRSHLKGWYIWEVVFWEGKLWFITSLKRVLERKIGFLQNKKSRFWKTTSTNHWKVWWRYSWRIFIRGVFFHKDIQKIS